MAEEYARSRSFWDFLVEVGRKILIVLGAIFVGFALYQAFEMWIFEAIMAGAAISWAMWSSVLKVPATYVLVVPETFEIALYEFPKAELKNWKKTFQFP